MRPLNLLPRMTVWQRYSRFMLLGIAVATAAALGAIVIEAGSDHRAAGRMEQEIAQLEQRVRSLETEPQADPAVKRYEELKAKLSSLQSGRADWPQLVKLIEEPLPPGASLISVSASAGPQLRLQYTFAQESDIIAYLAAVQRIPRVDHARMTGMTKQVQSLPTNYAVGMEIYFRPNEGVE
ncbi:hypothetical protein [Cohnella fermenti]|uniref:Fimbrial protein n=1 Tax=Cohnella fermenti TaxID=2565925 RepID=A0A4S4C392_9BACL|nr:hypothetical protein [Cohnella fermenti]THF82195.1 hypothetical protein E6C55_07380 [Cohnella fermenti]